MLSLSFSLFLFAWKFSAAQGVTRKFWCAHGIGWTKSTRIRLWKWTRWGWWTLQRGHSACAKTSTATCQRCQFHTNHFDEKANSRRQQWQHFRWPHQIQLTGKSTIILGRFVIFSSPTFQRNTFALCACLLQIFPFVNKSNKRPEIEFPFAAKRKRFFFLMKIYADSMKSAAGYLNPKFSLAAEKENEPIFGHSSHENVSYFIAHIILTRHYHWHHSFPLPMNWKFAEEYLFVIIISGHVHHLCQQSLTSFNVKKSIFFWISSKKQPFFKIVQHPQLLS